MNLEQDTFGFHTIALAVHRHAAGMPKYLSFTYAVDDRKPTYDSMSV